MNRRRSGDFFIGPFSGVVIACALLALSSCATFNRNNVAAKVGDRSLTTKEAEELAASGGVAATGDQLRQELTTWVRVAVLEASTNITAPAAPTTAADLNSRLTQAITKLGFPQAKSTYETGVSGSPLLCLAAITVAKIADANDVLTKLNAGASFSDMAHQFSTDTVIAQAGGVVKSQDGTHECIAPGRVNNAVVAALKDTPVGQPIAADLGSFSAVLMLRPFDELLPASQSSIANASVSQDQLDALVGSAKIYIDPRYGRWDPETSAVVTLTS